MPPLEGSDLKALDRCESRLVYHGQLIGGIDFLMLLPCTSCMFPSARTIHRSLVGGAVPRTVRERAPSSRFDHAHTPVPGRDEPTFDALLTRTAEAPSGWMARGRRSP